MFKRYLLTQTLKFEGMRILGIDPGLSGAIAILEEKKVLSIFDMPVMADGKKNKRQLNSCLLYTSPSPRDLSTSRMPSSA